jgi:dienelactone hydrolase
VAIGSCPGGTVALKIARSGADVAGVVSFHGSLDRHIFQTSGKSHGYAAGPLATSMLSWPGGVSDVPCCAFDLATSFLDISEYLPSV